MTARREAGARTAKGGARPAAGTARSMAGNRPAKSTSAKNRKPATQMRVGQGRNWGPIALFSTVGVLAAGIIGYGVWAVYQDGLTWEQRVERIDGIKDFRKDDPKSLEYTSHAYGPVAYKVLPPVGAAHNPNWQRCQGDVYNAPIASEHAVHSMEHGAVWITYRPDLPQAEVDKLADKVRGIDYMLMSPFPGLDQPISLQTWGYQLKLTSADDPRVGEFIKALRQVSSKEPGATCTAGDMITETGTTPRDLGKDGATQPAAGS